MLERATTRIDICALSQALDGFLWRMVHPLHEGSGPQSNPRPVTFLRTLVRRDASGLNGSWSYAPALPVSGTGRTKLAGSRTEAVGCAKTLEGEDTCRNARRLGTERRQRSMRPAISIQVPRICQVGPGTSWLGSHPRHGRRWKPSLKGARSKP